MASLTLSDADRLAIILKKLTTTGVADPGYHHIDKLAFAHRELVHIVLGEGVDKGARSYRLRVELLARGMLDELERLDRADPNINLDEAQITDTWEFFGLDKAYEPMEPLQWLVQGLIPRPSVSIIFGAPKSLKTLLVQDMALCVASGQKWLSAHPGRPAATGADLGKGVGFDTTPVVTMWLDFENGARRMRERFAAFGRARELPADTLITCASMPTPWLDAGKAEHVGNLMRRIEHFDAGLVIIDHLTQITGSIDENTSEMATVMSNLRGMAEALNLAVVLIHHQIKGASRFGITASDSLRGHGSILASCDLAALVERSVTQKDQIGVRPAAVRGAGVDNFAAFFTYEHKQDGSLELDKARFWGVPPETAEQGIEQALIDTVSDEPGINQTALRAAVAELLDVGDATIRKAISRLVRDGRFTVTDGKKGAKHYSLAEGAS
jgi:hypothetical protein